MDNKLSELSKPVGRFAFEPLAERWYHIKHSEKQNLEGGPWELKKFYSQEYVSALLTALRNLYAACDTGERRGDGSQQGVAMPDWGTVDSVRALLESINNG
jgi:hypothetical protein